MVDEVVVPMKSSSDPTLFWRGDFPSDHVVLQPIQPLVEEVVMLMQSLVDPTLLLESFESTKVVTPMKSSIDPTLLLESEESTKLVMPMQYLDDPTLLMGSDVSTDYVFSISSSRISKQGGIFLTSRTPPASPRMVSFDWNDLVEPSIPSYIPFKIRVEVNSKNIY
jgi:hypothetical protein